MYKIKAMFNKQEGFITVQYVNTKHQAKEYIRALKHSHKVEAFYSRVF